MIFIGLYKGLLDLGDPILTRFETFYQPMAPFDPPKSGPKEGSRSISIPPMVGDNANF